MIHNIPSHGHTDLFFGSYTSEISYFEYELRILITVLKSLRTSLITSSEGIHRCSYTGRKSINILKAFDSSAKSTSMELVLIYSHP